MTREDKLRAIRESSEAMFRHMDTLYGILYLVNGAQTENQRARLYFIMQQEGDDLRAAADRLNQAIQELQAKKKEERKMNRVMLMGMVLLMVVLLFGGTAVAQEQAEMATNTPQVVETVEAPVVETPVLIEPGDGQPPVVVVNDGLDPEFWILATVIFGLLAAIVLVLRPLIVQLGASAPAWSVEAAFQAIQTMLQEAIRVASKTPSKVDDELVAELQRQVELMRDEIRRLRDMPVSASRSVPVPESPHHVA